MAIDQKAIAVIVCSAVLNPLAVLAVCGRFRARRLRKTSIGEDDWTIAAALGLSVILSALGIWASATGLFTIPLPQMTRSQYELSRKEQFSEVLVFHVAIGLIKISVLLFYKRIFTILWFYYVSNFLLAVVSVWIVASFFSVIAAFRGVSSYWTAPPSQIITWQEINYATFIVITAGLDVALDIVILSLPTFVIRTLRMSFQRKVKVTVVFLLGAFCLVASIVRLYYSKQLTSFTAVNVATEAFITSSLNQAVWAHIEIYISIVTACLPPMGPIIRDSPSLDYILNSVTSIFARSSNSVASPKPGKRTTKPGYQDHTVGILGQQLYSPGSP